MPFFVLILKKNGKSGKGIYKKHLTDVYEEYMEIKPFKSFPGLGFVELLWLSLFLF